MTTPRLLVLSTVHRADDTRIREKLIGSLGALGDVTYATRPPPPSDNGGIADWRELGGGRLRRNLAALPLLWGRRFHLAVVHDPELLPAAIVGGGLLRRRIVVDVHENVPAQVLTKPWLPRPMRRPMASLLRLLLRIAERTCAVTLAEPGYATLFAGHHPVFPNYPAELPPPAPSNGTVIYVGDVTEQRGALDLAAAAEALGISATTVLVGPCRADTRASLLALAPGLQVLGPQPHGEAMDLMRHAAVAVAPLHDVPNYRHSLPTKVIEYLGCGVPVLASDLPGTRQAVGGLPGVRFVAPGDREALTEALRTALDDVAWRAAAQADAPAVRARFRWPDGDVRQFYGELLGPGRPAPG